MQCFFLAAFLASAPAVLDDAAPDYATQIAPLFKKYCAGCHNQEEREGDFSIESLADLMRGTPKGAVVEPGRADRSRLFTQLTGTSKPAMPPKGEPRPSAEEIARVRSWIDAGAKGPRDEELARLALAVPRLAPYAGRKPVTALAASPDGKWLAQGGFAAVAIHRTSADLAVPDEPPARVLQGFPGKVTALHFDAKGSRLVTASGVAGLGGIAALWNVADGSLIRKFEGHRDLLFDAELSPDGKVLATCGYDRVIRLWNAEDGQPVLALEGHNGAVYDLAFSPDGLFLVSASADDTCKVWRVRDGARLDTLPQPLKEEYCCAFTPDGKQIVAAGADNTLRVWTFVSRDKPRINPMVVARYAHEAPIVRLAFSPDGSRLVTTAEDRTVKVWETAGFTEVGIWERQPDVAVGLAISADGTAIRVGRLDGSSERWVLPSVGERTRPGLAGKPEPAPSSAAERTLARQTEHEPNDRPDAANDVTLPAEISGVISGRAAGNPDADVFRFRARRGEAWILEVNAARSGSKLDSVIEVLDEQGKRLERVRLQAVRDSYYTFRGKDDTQVGDFRLFNWEEMHLNEYLYSNGEVIKLWLAPRGPDSGFLVYPGQGSRWGWFDTTPLSHALGEPCYIVQPLAPEAKAIPNGLPVFPIYFENDDESRRGLGKDSKLQFVAPHDGTYLVRIQDVRGFEGADYRYTLTIRQPRPDFQATLEPPKNPIATGGAQEFRVAVKRIDGFDGPIRVDVTGLPASLSVSSPLEIEAGQIEAFGVVAATGGTAATFPGGKVSATATVAGRVVTHEVGVLGPLKLSGKPGLVVQILPAEDGPKPQAASAGRPAEYEIHPGQTITLTVKVQRNGQAGPVSLGNEGAGRNLPFGVIVDNLGLNGLLITENQDERTFYVTADRAVVPQSRPFHLTTSAGGGQSSHPVILRVR